MHIFCFNNFETLIERRQNFNINLNQEIVESLILFMLAGYETTSTCLTYATYVFAKHHDEQEKLYDEINGHFGNDSNVN